MRKILLIVFLATGLKISAQSVDYPLNHDAYHFLAKWQTQNEIALKTSVKPYSRQKSAQFLKPDLDSVLTVSDFNRSYLLKESNPELFLGPQKKPTGKFFTHFYRDKINFLSHADESLKINLNPIWHFNAGGEKSPGGLNYINSRGLEIWGSIDNKVGFYTLFTENQARFPNYIRSTADSVGVIPYEGFWKGIDNGGSDFLRAIGYIDFNLTSHIQAQMGFGRHFIGHGNRSLFLSDFSNSYPYLKITGDVWKIKYTNLYAQLIADVETYAGGNLGNRTYPTKFMASHYLDFQVTPKLSIGLFESIIFGKPDSLGGSKLKPSYLNPVIFYRAVEQQDGSADNALLGIDFKWSLWKKVMLYGQFILDEMVVSELTSGNNWWGNKYGYQAGAHYFDFLTDNLDINIEYNAVRPFTYAHETVYTSYTHYRQPLAHPMGANFRETIFQARYQPINRLTFKGILLLAEYGQDIETGVNVGKNPNISYNLRNGEYNHVIGQGNYTQLKMFQLQGSYQVSHNLFLDGTMIWRKEQTERYFPTSETIIYSIGFRWNTPFRNYLF